MAKKKAQPAKTVEPAPPKPINYLKLDAKFHAAVHKVKNGKSVPDDEWMIFLATDNAFPATLRFYLEECKRLGADQDHVESVQRTIRRLRFLAGCECRSLQVPDATGEKLLG